MIVTLAETKKYLRVDYKDEDTFIKDAIHTAETLCADTLRKPITKTYLNRVAVLFAVAYLFEHREDADMAELTKMLRHILSTEREVAF